MVVRLSDFLNTSFSTFSANDTNNTGITYPGAVVHNTTLTPGVGIGAGLDYQVETTNNNTETGMRLETVTTDVTAGSEDFDFVVKLMQNGATASEKLRVTSAGNVSVTGVINAAAILINNLSIISTLNGANTAVGTGANAFTSATIAGANSAVGTAANNFAIATFGAANTRPVGNTLSSSFTSRSTRRTLNFIPGSNITINVDDDSTGDRANVTIASTGGSGGASVFSGNVGNASANTFNVAHNLAKTFVIPAVRENSTGYYVYPDLKYTTPNHIVVEFVNAPSTNQYTVIVLG